MGVLQSPNNVAILGRNSTASLPPLFAIISAEGMYWCAVLTQEMVHANLPNTISQSEGFQKDLAQKWVLESAKLLPYSRITARKALCAVSLGSKRST